MHWLQDPDESNLDNVINVRCEAMHLWNH